MNKISAFTLIELLIVVAIIGILAAIAVPNLQSAQVRAKLAQTYGNMKSIQTAVQAYSLDHGMAPIDKGKDAQNGLTYHALTSPIAYINSIDLFRDEFKTHLEEDQGLFFAYGSPYHLGNLDDQERIQIFQRAGIQYFLFGWGPDRTPDWPWKILGETLLKLKTPSKAGPMGDGGIFYSPTNGLRSSGDIISTNHRIYQ
jgi:prepilin-type N-terminal cleavage/methylation domain-containing protein